MRYFKARGRKNRSYTKDSRTIPVKGYDEDQGRYYRCWNCGFVCDSTRDTLGNAESGGGDGHEDYHTPAYGTADTSDDVNSLAVLQGGMVALQLESDGTTHGIRHDHKSAVNSGCPMCGTLNYRGDY